MNEATFYNWLVIAWLVLAALSFVALFFVTAPYGRFTRDGWGPRVPSRWGWVLMESPSLLVFVALFGLGRGRSEPVALLLLAMWVVHYAHRSFIYPFRLRSSRPSMTLSVIAMGAAFNIGNAYLNGRYLFALGPALESSRLFDPRFLSGFLLFVAGFALNQHSDRILLGLRRPGETIYRIPRGGAYRYVSCPNYLGEIIEWGGWALACWNLGALAFFVWTAANLAPRAVKTHRWYQEQFPDYPPERKAILPYLM